MQVFLPRIVALPVCATERLEVSLGKGRMRMRARPPPLGGRILANMWLWKPCLKRQREAPQISMRALFRWPHLTVPRKKRASQRT